MFVYGCHCHVSTRDQTFDSANQELILAFITLNKHELIYKQLLVQVSEYSPTVLTITVLVLEDHVTFEVSC